VLPVPKPMRMPLFTSFSASAAAFRFAVCIIVL
jgi:hypothetical protein